MTTSRTSLSADKQIAGGGHEDLSWLSTTSNARSETPSVVKTGSIGKPRPRADAHVTVRALLFFSMVFFASTPCLLFGGVRGAEQWGSISDSGPLFPIIAGSVYALTFAAIPFFFRKNMGRILRGWPVALVVAFAFLSSIWSLNPLLTLSKSVALLGTTAVGVLAAVALSPGQQIRYLLTAFAVLMTASLVTGIALPGLAFDGGGGGGMLHGIYAQKNALGWAAATAALLVIGALFGGSVNMLAGSAALFVAVGAIVWARSATGIVVSLSAISIYLTFWLLRKSDKYWGLTLIALLIVLITTFAFRDLISGSIFSALGKGSDLTGRTTIWSSLQEAIMARPFGGFGYQAFWSDPIALYYMRGAFFAGNAQGGFHEILVNIGFVGLALYLAVVGISIWRLSLRAIKGNQIAMVYSTTLICMMIMGITSPTLLAVNIIYWPIVVMAYLYSTNRSRFF